MNAATPGHREGRTYEPPHGPELTRAVAQALRTDRSTSPVRAGAVPGLVEVAAKLREVITAVDAGDHDCAAALVNQMLDQSGAYPVLERHDDQPWHLHFHARAGGQVANWTAACATGLAVALGSEYADRLGVCSAPSCDRVFVDTSRNGTRRFCGVACQSRVKTAAYRARAARRTPGG